jgi:DNA-directed RNA polymerase specialized sigma24 family protein
MREHTMKDSFLKAYDAHVDDIFAYCYRETAHRDVAKYLTKNVFSEVWDTIVYYGLDSISNLKRLIYRTAKDHVGKFTAGKRTQMAYYDNLWNLTLSQ